MVSINSSRLLNDLRTLRAIGGVSTGVVRPAFSDKDIEAREWLKIQFENAGLKKFDRWCWKCFWEIKK